MKRFEMIKDKNYFNNIIKKGKFVKDKNFVIYYIYNKDEFHFSRFGIAIKNSIGKAVHRNKFKRQARNLIDLNKKLFKKDFDYIIMIREGFKENNFKNLDESLKSLMKGIN